jgi:hypothetical protein
MKHVSGIKDRESHSCKKGKVILTSVVGTNSDPSENPFMDNISFSVCLPRLPQVPLKARLIK